MLSRQKSFFISLYNNLSTLALSPRLSYVSHVTVDSLGTLADLWSEATSFELLETVLATV